MDDFEILIAIVVAGLGALFGAGGFGGFWAYVTSKRSNESRVAVAQIADDNAALRQWYADISARVRELESVTMEQQRVIGEQQATIAQLMTERAHLQIQRDDLSRHIEKLERRLDDHKTLIEDSDGFRS